MTEKFFQALGTDVRKRRRRPSSVTEPVPSGSLGVAATLASISQLSDAKPARLRLVHNQQRWGTDGTTYWEASMTSDSLPGSIYRIEERSNIGICLCRIQCDTDDLLELPDAASVSVLQEIREFWTKAGEFKKRGFLFKRGVLLFGPPGTGKTATVQLLIKMILRDHEGIGVYIERPSHASAAFQMIRRVEPNRPIIALMEDLDSLVDVFGESEYLALLDGESQIDNVIFIGTTNYPERLDRRFVDRPSRFDSIVEVGPPSEAARRAFLATKEPTLVGEELEDWVERTDGFSLAHLREIIILCKCFNKTLDEAMTRMEYMRTRKNSTSFDSRESLGTSLINRFKAPGLEDA